MSDPTVSVNDDRRSKVVAARDLVLRQGARLDEGVDALDAIEREASHALGVNRVTLRAAGPEAFYGSGTAELTQRWQQAIEEVAAARSDFEAAMKVLGAFYDQGDDIASIPPKSPRLLSRVVKLLASAVEDARVEYDEIIVDLARSEGLENHPLHEVEQARLRRLREAERALAVVQGLRSFAGTFVGTRAPPHHRASVSVVVGAGGDIVGLPAYFPSMPPNTIHGLKFRRDRSPPHGTRVLLTNPDRVGFLDVKLRLPGNEEFVHFGELPIVDGVVTIPAPLAFLCHAKEDREAVKAIGLRLRNRGILTWFDEHDLLPGDRWEDRIEEEIERSDCVLAFLSPRSVSKTGYVQRELRYALKQQDMRPRTQAYVIPVMLEECELPRELRDLHCSQMWLDDAHTKLVRAIYKAAGVGVLMNEDGTDTAALRAAQAAVAAQRDTWEKRLRTETERADAWRVVAVGDILARPPVTLVGSTPLAVLHLIPAASLDGAQRVSLEKDHERVTSELSPVSEGGWGWTFHADSVTAVAAPDCEAPVYNYNRLFDVGVLQCVEAVPSDWLDHVALHAVRGLRSLLPALGKLGFHGRCFVTLDVLRAKGSTLAPSRSQYAPRRGRPIADERLSAPPEVVENADAADAGAILKPILDRIWRAAGYEKCTYYDEHGAFRPA